MTTIGPQMMRSVCADFCSDMGIRNIAPTVERDWFGTAVTISTPIPTRTNVKTCYGGQVKAPVMVIGRIERANHSTVFVQVAVG